MPERRRRTRTYVKGGTARENFSTAPEKVDPRRMGPDVPMAGAHKVSMPATPQVSSVVKPTSPVAASSVAPKKQPAAPKVQTPGKTAPRTAAPMSKANPTRMVTPVGVKRGSMAPVAPKAPTPVKAAAPVTKQPVRAARKSLSPDRDGSAYATMRSRRNAMRKR